jgi:hypothetical protein
MHALAMLAAATLVAAAPAAAQTPAADAPVSGTPAATPAAVAEPRAEPARWEHLVYAHVEGACRVVTSGRGGTVAGKCLDVMRKLGAADEELPPRDAISDAYDAAALDVLGRRGWELVSCETREVTTSLLGARGDQLTCWLKRAVAGSAVPAAPTAP